MEDSMEISSTTKVKNSVFKKMLQSLTTFPRGGRGRSSSDNTGPHILPKSKSWHCRNSTSKTKRHVIPHGCFSVYVGEEKQKFLIKTECANHPLFKMLLEDAELEYGFNSDGPILIPCEVDLFYKVLAEMDLDGTREEIHSGCGFAYGSCSPFVNPTRRFGRTGDAGHGYGSYGVLGSSTPSSLLKMNHF